MSYKRHPRRAARQILLIAVTLLTCAPAGAQVAPVTKSDKKVDKKAENHLAADAARWQYMLDDLTVEARAVAREEQRPLLPAEIADAYWDLNQSRSRELFAAALEAALALKARTREGGQALRHVLGLAARREAALARGLSEKVLESAAEKEWAASEAVSAAADLLDSDAARAAQLAQAQAPAGPSMDAAWFILQLSLRDRAAADKVYSAYLGRFAPGTGFGLDRLLWLAGYPFGYAEAFGGSTNPTQMVGFSGLRFNVPGPNHALAQNFLDVALVAAQHALSQASTADPQRAEALNGLVLFTAGYLMPEVRRYRPQALRQWLLIEQQATSGTPAALREGAAKRLQESVGSKPLPGRPEAAAALETGQAEDLLARAEKLPGGCRRDTDFAQAALSIAYAKDLSRALEVVRRIENEALRDGVTQFINYNMAAAAVARGDTVSLGDARKYAEQVNTPEQRALLYVKIARAVLRHEDRQLATTLLSQTAKLAEATSEPAARTGILLASAAGYSEFDAYEGYKALREAVKTVNGARTQNVDSFQVQRKVNLACRAGEDTWYGDSDRAERFSLFETFAAMARADLDGMLSLARELDDPSIRIRSLVSIARAMTKRALPKQPGQPTL